MPKKKRKSLATSFVKAVHKRASRKSGRTNPGEGGASAPNQVLDELISTMGPAAASFVATRLGARIVRMGVARRNPALAPHLSVLSSLAVLVTIYLVTAKVKRLQRYQIPAVVGSAVAILTTGIQTYLPKLAFLLDTSPVALPPAQAPVVSLPPPSAGDDDDLVDFDSSADFDADDLDAFKTGIFG